MITLPEICIKLLILSIQKSRIFLKREREGDSHCFLFQWVQLVIKNNIISRSYAKFLSDMERADFQPSAVEGFPLVCIKLEFLPCSDTFKENACKFNILTSTLQDYMYCLKPFYFLQVRVQIGLLPSHLRLITMLFYPGMKFLYGKYLTNLVK